MLYLGILVFDEVEVLDFAGPFEVFSVASQLSGYQFLTVQTIGLKDGPTSTKNGLKVLTDLRLEEVSHLDFLVLPGGDGTKMVIQNQSVLDKLKQLTEKSQWTMSVCSGSRILGKTGFLENKSYCTHHEVYPDMQRIVPSGIPQIDKRFTQSDERIWTAAGISAGIDLSLHLLSLTFGQKLAQETAEYMEYLPYLNRS